MRLYLYECVFSFNKEWLLVLYMMQVFGRIQIHIFFIHAILNDTQG